ncbi:MAG: hypothetical protein AAGF78_00865 [Pseudomonadota bacterium]
MWLKTTQQYEAETHARQRADAEERALRLHPDDVTRWTDVMKAVAPTVRTGARPCDYRPWQAALDAYGRVPHWIGKATLAEGMVAAQLMWMAWDVAQPAWPAPRRDLIDFALTFLEADVMLFRSGYCKKLLLRRLRQAPLAAGDMASLDGLIRRSVARGTGLEEFREYAKLAAKLELDGRLPGLRQWLEAEARGAVITGWEYIEMHTSGLNFEALLEAYGRQRTAFFRYPDFTEMTGRPRPDAASKAKRNAWLILMQIARTERAQGANA